MVNLMESSLAASEGSCIVVVGGAGQLGAVLVEALKAKFGTRYAIVSIDPKQNPHATLNLHPQDNMEQIEQLRGIHSIFCAAGGWAGNQIDDSLSKIMQVHTQMHSQNLASAMMVAGLAKYCRGLIVFVGAEASLRECPTMLSYGACKAGLVHLAGSLAAAAAQEGKEYRVITLLPQTLDTSMNRKWMGEEGAIGWTPLKWIADLYIGWLDGCEEKGDGSECTKIPSNGSMLLVKTRQGVTSAHPK